MNFLYVFLVSPILVIRRILEFIIVAATSRNHVCRLIFYMPSSRYLPNHFLLNLICAVYISIPSKEARAFSKLIFCMPILKASFAYSYSKYTTLENLRNAYNTYVLCSKDMGTHCSPRLFYFCSVRFLYAMQELTVNVVLISSYVSFPGLLNRFGWNLVVDVKYLTN